jgi:hypothetical protein
MTRNIGEAITKLSKTTHFQQPQCMKHVWPARLRKWWCRKAEKMGRATRRGRGQEETNHSAMDLAGMIPQDNHAQKLDSMVVGELARGKMQMCLKPPPTRTASNLFFMGGPRIHTLGVQACPIKPHSDSPKSET